MTKKKTKAKVDLLFQNFVGEPISVMLDQFREETEQTETHIKTIKSPISAQGYLVDIDDDFLYIGYEPLIIAQAIRRERILQVELMEISEEMMMADIILPDTDKGYN